MLKGEILNPNIEILNKFKSPKIQNVFEHLKFEF